MCSNGRAARLLTLGMTVEEFMFTRAAASGVNCLYCRHTGCYWKQASLRDDLSTPPSPCCSQMFASHVNHEQDVL